MRCVGYICVSDPYQTNSIYHQHFILRTYCTSMHWTLSCVYLDIGSPSLNSETEFQDMISAAQQGEFDIVLSIDSTLVSLSKHCLNGLQNIIDQYGIQVISLDTTDY